MQNGRVLSRWIEEDFLNSEEAVEMRVLADAFCSSIFGSKVPGGVFTAKGRALRRHGHFFPYLEK